MNLEIKVVCINVNILYKNNPFNDSLSKLELNKVYTEVSSDVSSIYLKEVKSSHPSGGYDISRFRRVSAIKTKEIAKSFEEIIEVPEKTPELIPETV